MSVNGEENAAEQPKASGILDFITKSDQLHPNACFEVFKQHWTQILKIIEKGTLNQDDIDPMIYYMDQMICLLTSDHQLNSIYVYAIRENIFSRILEWTNFCHGDARDQLRLRQLSLFEVIVCDAESAHSSSSSAASLNHEELLQPLLVLLHNLSIRSSVRVERILVRILHQLCVFLTRDIELFQMCSTIGQCIVEDPFLVLTLLVPFIHRESESIGRVARDALLLIMCLSGSNEEVARIIAFKSDFCPILATGLNALYSSLPRRLNNLMGASPPSSTSAAPSSSPPAQNSARNFGGIHQLSDQDVTWSKELTQFLTSLDFCNTTIQVAHPVVREALLHYIYNGFLVPVLGSALNQSSLEEVIAATAYLDLFLRRATQPDLLKAFLTFILTEKHDNFTILDSFISRINSNTMAANNGMYALGVITLTLFQTLLDFHCEDVMFHLIFRHLIPCRHLLTYHLQVASSALGVTAAAAAQSSSQSLSPLKDNEVYWKSAEKFYSLIYQLIPSTANYSTAAQQSPSSAIQNPVVSEGGVATLQSSSASQINSSDTASNESISGGGNTHYSRYLHEAGRAIDHRIDISSAWQLDYDGGVRMMWPSATGFGGGGGSTANRSLFACPPMMMTPLSVAAAAGGGGGAEMAMEMDYRTAGTFGESQPPNMSMIMMMTGDAAQLEHGDSDNLGDEAEEMTVPLEPPEIPVVRPASKKFQAAAFQRFIDHQYELQQLRKACWTTTPSNTNLQAQQQSTTANKNATIQQNREPMGELGSSQKENRVSGVSNTEEDGSSRMRGARGERLGEKLEFDSEDEQEMNGADEEDHSNRNNHINIASDDDDAATEVAQEDQDVLDRDDDDDNKNNSLSSLPLPNDDDVDNDNGKEHDKHEVTAFQNPKNKLFTKTSWKVRLDVCDMIGFFRSVQEVPELKIAEIARKIGESQQLDEKEEDDEENEGEHLMGGRGIGANLSQYINQVFEDLQLKDEEDYEANERAGEFRKQKEEGEEEKMRTDDRTDRRTSRRADDEKKRMERMLQNGGGTAINSVEHDADFTDQLISSDASEIGLAKHKILFHHAHHHHHSHTHSPAKQHNHHLRFPSQRQHLPPSTADESSAEMQQNHHLTQYNHQEPHRDNRGGVTTAATSAGGGGGGVAGDARMMFRGDGCSSSCSGADSLEEDVLQCGYSEEVSISNAGVPGGGGAAPLQRGGGGGVTGPNGANGWPLGWGRRDSLVRNYHKTSKIYARGGSAETSGVAAGGRGGGGMAANRRANAAPSVGPFLTTLLCKLEAFPQNSVQINILLTGIFSSLAAYPHSLLKSFLLNTATTFLQPNVRSLYEILCDIRATILDHSYRINEVTQEINCSEFWNLCREARDYLQLRWSFTSRAQPIPAHLVSVIDYLPDDLRNGGAAEGGGMAGCGASGKDLKKRPTAFRSRSLGIFGFVTGRRQFPLRQIGTSSSSNSRTNATNEFEREAASSPKLQNESGATGSGGGGGVIRGEFDTLDCVKSRNLIFCSVIFIEFCKELSALCREHTVRIF